MKKIIATSLLLTLLVSVYAYLTPNALPPIHLVSLLPANYGKTAVNKPTSYLIRNVSVIPMNRDTILTHQQVYIDNGDFYNQYKKIHGVMLKGKWFNRQELNKMLMDVKKSHIE